MELKHQIMIARKDKGYTQESLGKEVGKTKTTVGMWERGTSSPTLATLELLSKVLEYDFTIKQ